MPPDIRDKTPEPLLVGEGGVQHRPSIEGDSLNSLFELMEVVEALCPVWPTGPTTRGADFKL
jgi:hypothetical protein